MERITTGVVWHDVIRDVRLDGFDDGVIDASNGKRDANLIMSDLFGKSPALSSVSTATLVTSSSELSNAASSQRRVQFCRATISGSDRALK